MNAFIEREKEAGLRGLYLLHDKRQPTSSVGPRANISFRNTTNFLVE